MCYRVSILAFVPLLVYQADSLCSPSDHLANNPHKTFWILQTFIYYWIFWISYLSAFYSINLCITIWLRPTHFTWMWDQSFSHSKCLLHMYLTLSNNSYILLNVTHPVSIRDYLIQIVWVRIKTYKVYRLKFLIWKKQKMGECNFWNWQNRID